MVLFLFQGLLNISVNAFPQLGVEFENYGDVKVEWVSDTVYNGNYAVKIYLTSSDSTGKGILKVLYNNAFNTLDSFSFYVKYSTSVPRFLIYLDKNNDGQTDTTLMSDYLDVGNNLWVLGTGGLKWGWSERDYPSYSYGDPWNNFDYWKSMYPDAIVKYVGIISSPDTILNPVYVDDIIINGISYDLEPSPTLTVSISGSGTVSKSPSKTSYAYGETVQLTATPATGYIFSGWSGGLTGLTNTVSVTMNGNKVVIATFTQITVINDQAIVSDNRCDVKSTQTVRFHFKWGHGGDVNLGTVIITESSSYGLNSYEFQLINDGWITFNVTSDNIVKKTWKVSQVNCNGITQFVSNESPNIIWDRVKLQLTVENERIQILNSPKIDVSGFYEYDNTIFNDKVIFNDTTIIKDNIGKSGFKITSISDSKWGLTSFTSNEVYCIYDTIKTKVDYQTITPAKVTVSISLNYESDGMYINDALVRINDNKINNIGDGKYVYSIGTINPFINFILQIDKSGFITTTLPVSTLVLGNFIIELLIIISIIIIIILKILSTKKYAIKKKELLKIINTEKSININEISGKLKLNKLSTNKMISELQSNKKIKGYYSVDNKYFIIEEKIYDEIRKRLE